MLFNLFGRRGRYLSTARGKIVDSVDAALDHPLLRDGAKILVGGFGLCGIPSALIQGVIKRGITDLTVVSNNCGVDDWGLGLLLNNRQIRRMISSYVGENKEFERQYLQGELEVELTPQGTLAERLRAGGAGIPAFYTPTSVGTVINLGGFPMKYSSNGDVEIASPPREIRDFNGRSYVMEEAIRGDIGLVKAWKGDRFGNLVFRGTARNFNPECAQAAQFTIAEIEEIVDHIDPDQVHLPGVFVHRIVQANSEKRIERVTNSTGNVVVADDSPQARLRERIVRRAALELQDGMAVNLGIGMPTLASNYVPGGTSIQLQSENGIIGFGGYPEPGDEDADFINAGKETITTAPGSSTFSSSASFAMIRGQHIDVAILGALQVASNGDIANWIVPKKMVKGMGGAMDLVASGTRVVVTMEHSTKSGQPKLLDQCNLPLTGAGCVDMVITELGVFKIDRKVKSFRLVEIADGVTVEEILSKTGGRVQVDDNLVPMKQS